MYDLEIKLAKIGVQVTKQQYDLLLLVENTWGSYIKLIAELY